MEWLTLDTPRFLWAASTLIAMSVISANAMLIWAFNPGEEIRVWPRAGFHAVLALFLLRRFVIIVRSEGGIWTWEGVTGILTTVALAGFAVALLFTIMSQIESDRTERKRLRSEAERRIRARKNV